MIKEFFLKRQVGYTDVQVIAGLQQRDKRTEEWFYHAAKRYFNDHFNEVFFDQDRRQEIFQTAFLKLWTEISNSRICLLEEKICRQQRNGEYQPMTCTLTTFLMAFAKNEFRELVRSMKYDSYDQLLDDDRRADVETVCSGLDEDVDELRNRIIDDCISELSPRCADILTLFYYNGMNLDDILEIRSDKNQSKNGLKTAKNKCMNTLKERVVSEFKRFNLTA